MRPPPSHFSAALRHAPLALLIGLCALWLGCAAPPRAVLAEPEAAALSSAALDTLEREACPRLLARTFPLDDPHAKVSTGRLWVRRCTAKRTAAALDLDVDVLGWQWAGEGSWGFEVREYVYFSASINAGLSASIDAVGDGVRLRVWTDKPPEVHVRAIGRVAAKASTPAASLLGAASRLVGQGPNVLATAALRSRVRDLIAEHASAGIPIAIGEAPAVRGAPAAAHALLEEREGLHPGGALISGSFAAGVTATLRWSVDGDAVALARPVCVEEALDLVDAVVADRPPPDARTPHDVLTLAGKGEAVLPALACRWVLVTGARDDRPVSVALVLVERAERVVAKAAARWVRATLAAYDLSAAVPASAGAEERGDSLAVTFSVGPGGAPRSFGRALPSSKSPSVGLVAPLFEVARDASVEVRALQQHPRAPSLFNATPGYDETVLGLGTITLQAGKRHQEHQVALTREGRSMGWARFDIEVMDIE
jgi:hypothetical protein